MTGARSTLWLRRLALACVMLAAACDFGGGAEGGGCGGGCFRVHQGDYTFPLKRITQESISVRVTQAGVDFITERIKELIYIFFDADDEGRAIISLASLGIDDLGTELGPLSGSVRDMVLSLDLSELSVEFVPGSDPARIRIHVEDAEVGIVSGVVAGAIDGLIFNGDAACGLGNGPDGFVARLSFDIELELGTAPDGTLDVSVASLQVDIQDLALEVITDCSIDECLDGEIPPTESECGECKTICGVASLASDLAGFVQDLLDDLIDDLIGFVGDDLANLLLDLFLNGQPLALEGTLDIAKLAGPILPYATSVHPLGILGRPAGEGFQVSGLADGAGLDVTLDAGVDASPVHACVGDIGAEPVFVAGPRPEWPDALVGEDGEARPYHLGLGVSEALVNSAIWAAWKSGVLCIDITTRDLYQLTGGQLDLTARTLNLLLPGLVGVAGPDAPVRVRVRPRLTGDAGPVVTFDEDPTLTLTLVDAVVAIEVDAGDHFLRAISFDADLRVGLAIDALPDARLGLRVADIALDNVGLPDNEIFAAARMDLIVPIVVDLAMGLISDIPIELDLSTAGLSTDLLGLPVEPVIADVGPAGPAQDWLGILIELVDPGEIPQAMSAPGLDLYQVFPGEAEVYAHAPDDHEVQIRVSGGGWTDWFPAGAAHRVSHPRLWLLGEGWIEARSRPRGGLPGPTQRIALLLEQGPEGLSAFAGPPGSLARVQTSDAPPEGCAGGGGDAPLAAALLLGLVALVRRRRALLALLVVLGLGACAGNESPPDIRCEFHDQCPDDYLCGLEGVCVGATPCGASAECCPGSDCFNGWCRPTTHCDEDTPICEGLGEVCEAGQCVPGPCSRDSDCPGSQRCTGGRCLAGLPCEGACESLEGQTCHVTSGRCLSTPACLEPCPLGTVRTVADESTLTPLQCGGLETGCTCTPLPEVPPGLPGVDVRLLALEGAPLMLSYEPVYGDLVLSRASADLSDRTDHVLDGVPDSDPTAGTGGYRGGVSDPGPDRGRRPALVVDQTEGGLVIDVLYRDSDLKSVRHMRVDAASGAVLARSRPEIEGIAGRWSCLTRDPSSGALVGLVFVERDPDGLFSSLVEVRSSASPPTSAADWEVTTVLQRPLPLTDPAPCDDACGLLDLCVQRPDGEGTACASPLDGLSCPEGCGAHQVCWSPPKPETAAEDDPAPPPVCAPRIYRSGSAADPDTLPFGEGLFATCAAAPGELWAAWYDADHGLLRAAEAPFATAVPELVAGTEAAWDGDDRGRHAHLVVRPDGRPAVAFHDASAGALMYAEREGAGAWAVELVDEGELEGDSLDMGVWPALLIGEDGEPLIAYADATRADIHLARRRPGCWARAPALTSGGYTFPDLARDPEGGYLLAALRYGFADDLTPSHQLLVTPVEAPTACPE